MSKAQATVSKTQADIDEIEADLASAKTKLKVLQAGDKAVDKVTGPFADQAAFLRQRSEANVSAARADVDELAAKLEAAKTKHKMAVSALNALEAVTD